MYHIKVEWIDANLEKQKQNIYDFKEHKLIPKANKFKQKLISENCINIKILIVDHYGNIIKECTEEELKDSNSPMFFIMVLLCGIVAAYNWIVAIGLTLLLGVIFIMAAKITEFPFEIAKIISSIVFVLAILLFGTTIFSMV